MKEYLIQDHISFFRLSGAPLSTWAMEVSTFYTFFYKWNHSINFDWSTVLWLVESSVEGQISIISVYDSAVYRRARRNTNGLGLNCSFRKNFNPFYNTTALGSVRNQTQQSKMVFDDQQLNFFTTLIHWKSHHSYPLNQI